jgi:class III poly(R)-hydroxyalkanoic acid synthase PhaE subunit
MKETDAWIEQWIAQQRELLSRGPVQSGQTQPDPAAGPGGKAAFADPFNIGSALLGAWANAGLLQSSVAQQLSDFFGRLPPIGLAREQTEAWRELAAAQAECRQIENELRAVLVKVQLDALDLLSERVRERGAAAPVEGFRALYDLWVECGEQVYNKLAHSDAYSKLQAELGNATMRLRSRLQVVLEYNLKQFDLPTRSELNSLHRQVRELRIQIEGLTAGPTAKAPSKGAKNERRKTAKRPAGKPK